jgi:hypothetical protein
MILFDVEEPSTHGGSLRIYACHRSDNTKPVSNRVMEIRSREIQSGFTRVDFYEFFGKRVEETKRKLLDFLIRAKQAGKSVAGYGAPGKGNTLLNYCGVRTEFLD